MDQKGSTLVDVTGNGFDIPVSEVVHKIPHSKLSSYYAPVQHMPILVSSPLATHSCLVSGFYSMLCCVWLIFNALLWHVHPFIALVFSFSFSPAFSRVSSLSSWRGLPAIHPHPDCHPSTPSLLCFVRTVLSSLDTLVTALTLLPLLLSLSPFPSHSLSPSFLRPLQLGADPTLSIAAGNIRHMPVFSTDTPPLIGGSLSYSETVSSLYSPITGYFQLATPGHQDADTSTREPINAQLTRAPTGVIVTVQEAGSGTFRPITGNTDTFCAFGNVSVALPPGMRYAEIAFSVGQSSLIANGQQVLVQIEKIVNHQPITGQDRGACAR